MKERNGNQGEWKSEGKQSSRREGRNAIETEGCMDRVQIVKTVFRLDRGKVWDGMTEMQEFDSP